MSELKFKKGDWCFCEFNLQQIMETEENRITEVSDGMFRMGGYDLSDRCFPMTLSIKRVSDSVKYWSEQFHKTNHNGLNYPDLNRALIEHWVGICETIDDKELTQQKIDNLGDFGKSVLEEVDSLKNKHVQGVRVFGNSIACNG
jgi:hypothetical protein